MRGSAGAFVSVCLPFESCPPSVIATVASERVVKGANIALPPDYDNEVLSNIRWLTGYYDKRVRVSPRQAHELRQIGAEILRLDGEGNIQPPLEKKKKILYFTLWILFLKICNFGLRVTGIAGIATITCRYGVCEL